VVLGGAAEIVGSGLGQRSDDLGMHVELLSIESTRMRMN